MARLFRMRRLLCCTCQSCPLDTLGFAKHCAGSNYERTRHNVGFMVIDQLARSESIDCRKLEKSAAVGRGEIGGRQVGGDMGGRCGGIQVMSGGHVFSQNNLNALASLVGFVADNVTANLTTHVTPLRAGPAGETRHLHEQQWGKCWCVSQVLQGDISLPACFCVLLYHNSEPAG